jgi:hypothetical protein
VNLRVNLCHEPLDYRPHKRVDCHGFDSLWHEWHIEADELRKEKFGDLLFAGFVDGSVKESESGFESLLGCVWDSWHADTPWYHAVQSDDCGRVLFVFAAQSDDCDGTLDAG